MKYVDYDFFNDIYGDTDISEATFNRLSWEVCRKLDIATTGADNVRKLAVAFPRDEYAAEAVRRCACKLIKIASEIEKSEETLNNAKGYVTREDGSLQGKVVSSVSAGNESISYAVSSGSSNATLIDKALADKSVQNKLYSDTISEYLSGVSDANGVSLLYMGEYTSRICSKG